MDDRSNGGIGSDGLASSGRDGDRTAARGPQRSAGANGRMSTRALIGSDACAADGRHLGCVEELILDPRSGQLDYVVIRVGGHGGPEGVLVAIPWRVVTVDGRRQPRMIVVDAGALDGAPRLQASSWPLLSDPAWAEEVHAHFCGRSATR